MVEKAEVYHSAHDDAKKNPKQLSLVKPEETHHLSKDGNCHHFDFVARANDDNVANRKHDDTLTTTA